MKTVLIVRHAQAEDKAAGQTDYDRSLTPLGYEQIAQTARRAKADGIAIDYILHSAALRTTETAQILAQICGGQLHADKNLYETQPSAWMAAVAALDDTIQTVALVGHNPTISTLAARLLASPVQMQTGQIIIYTIESSWPTWQSAEAHNIKMIVPEVG